MESFKMKCLKQIPKHTIGIKSMTQFLYPLLLEENKLECLFYSYHVEDFYSAAENRTICKNKVKNVCVF